MGSAADLGPVMSVQGLRRSSSVTRADEEAARRIFETCNRRDMCLGLKDAHFDVHDLKVCGFDAADLKFAGFSASELKSVGLDAKPLVSAGYDMFTLSTSGFSTEQLAQQDYPLISASSSKATSTKLSEITIQAPSTLSTNAASFMTSNQGGRSAPQRPTRCTCAPPTPGLPTPLYWWRETLIILLWLRKSMHHRGRKQNQDV